MTFKTEQELFWAGEFGTDYIDRNRGDKLLAANLNFFVKALAAARGIESCIEFGANIGMNLRALKLLHPTQQQHGIEINSDAAKQLGQLITSDNVFEGSIFDYQADREFDLVLIKGVLIHINPAELANVYDRLYKSTGKYLMVAEYYNPAPVAIPYRGHTDRLFKRDFAGELLDTYPDLSLADYGFAYRRDPNFPQDDITWFLLQKRG
jgi:pseudaminic acid biosynthesis-associated methylase